MKKTVVIVMVLSIVSKIMGFLRETVLAYFYGASNISDAYLISLTIPETLFAFIGIGLATSFIPVYSDIEKCGESDVSNKYVNNVINSILLLCTLLTILVWIFAPYIVKIFASGFTGETLALGINFTRITVLGIYFRGILYILKGHLQIYNNFIAPELVGVLFSLVMIMSIVFSSKYYMMALAIGFVLAKMTELIFVIPFAYKKNYRYKFFLDLKDVNLRRMIYLTLPAILGISIDQINTLIDRTIASRISVGGISALNYAFRLDLFIQGIFVMSIATVLYPKISKMAAEDDMKGFKKALSEAISVINVLVIPATVGAVIFAKPIVKLLFGRGAFDSQAISMTYYALIFYSVGMLGFGFREIFSRAFYSLQDTKTPVINAAIAIAINIILNFILSKFMGIGGLALATSISAIFCSLLLLISLRKKIGPFGMRKISIKFLKILYASSVMGIIAKFSFNYLTTIKSENLSLIAAVGIGAINYFIMIYLMRIDDLDVVISIAKKKFLIGLSMCKIYLMKIDGLDVVVNIVKKGFTRGLSICKTYLMKIDGLDVVLNVAKKKFSGGLPMCNTYLLKKDNLHVVINVAKKKFSRGLSMCKTYLMKIHGLDVLLNVAKKKFMGSLSICKTCLMKIGDMDVILNTVRKKFMRCISVGKASKGKESDCLIEAIMNTRQIQLTELDMLIEMDRICKDNNLRYYLAYGTALGAVRHQGFIPWDADIDIVVDIDNYKSFCDIIHREIPAKYTLRSIQTDDTYESLKARIAPQNQGHLETHIDIFPMVGVPDSQFGSKLFSQIAYIAYRGFFIKKVNPGINYKEVPLKRIIAILLKSLLILVPSKFFVWLFNKISVAFPIEKSDILYMFCGYCSEKELVPKSYFDIPQKMIFEGHEFPLPREWDKYLKHIYRDYMIPDRQV